MGFPSIRSQAISSFLPSHRRRLPAMRSSKQTVPPGRNTDTGKRLRDPVSPVPAIRGPVRTFGFVLSLVRLRHAMIRRSPTSLRFGILALALAFCAPLAFGQMPQPGSAQTLSSSDVSDEEVQKVASIMMSVRSSTRQDRMKMMKEMKQKYGNPQQMDSTQKAKMRRDVRKRRMAMQKKTMKIMQQEAKKENMDAKRVQTILRSAQQDSTLGKRLKQAMQSQMKQQGGMGGPQGGGPGQ